MLLWPGTATLRAEFEFHEFENLLAVSEIGETIGKLEALASELGVLFVNRNLENVF